MKESKKPKGRIYKKPRIPEEFSTFTDSRQEWKIFEVRKAVERFPQSRLWSITKIQRKDSVVYLFDPGQLHPTWQQLVIHGLFDEFRHLLKYENGGLFILDRKTMKPIYFLTRSK